MWCSAIVIIFNIILMAAIYFDQIAQEEKTKIFFAKIYFYSAFILALLSFEFCLWYFIVVNGYTNDLIENLEKFVKSNCISEPNGINIAI